MKAAVFYPRWTTWAFPFSCGLTAFSLCASLTSRGYALLMESLLFVAAIVLLIVTQIVRQRFRAKARIAYAKSGGNGADLRFL